MNRLITKLLGFVALVGILCLGTVRVASVVAAVTLPAGGDDFDTAVTIEAGSYVTDHEIEENSFEYFKISVTAGQILKVKVATPSGEYPYAGVTIYNSDEEEVTSQTIIGDQLTSKTATWARSYEDVGLFYILIGSEYDTNAIGTTYAVTVEDHFDAGSQSDAGGLLDNALTLSAVGTYQGYIVTDAHGTDLIDFYKLQFEKGAEVTVTVDPEGDARLDVEIYSADGEELANGSSSTDGAKATASLSEALESAVPLYIKVDATYQMAEEPIEYTLKISTTGGTATNGETTDDEEPTADGSTTATGPNWTLIGAGAILLVLTGVLAAAFLRKKEQPAPPKADQGEPASPKPEGEGGEQPTEESTES